MGDRSLWLFINSFADWLSALATIAAVVTALYLARRGDRIDLRVRAGVRVLLREGLPSLGEHLNVEVTNLGRRAAAVNTLFWTIGLLRKQHYTWIPPRNMFSASIPVMLDDGGCANYFMSIGDFDRNFEDLVIAGRFRGVVGYVRVWFMRVGVTTSTGRIVTRRIEKELRDRLLRTPDCPAATHPG